MLYIVSFKKVSLFFIKTDNYQNKELHQKE